MLISKVGIEKKKKTPALCGSLKVKYDDLGKMPGILQMLNQYGLPPTLPQMQYYAEHQLRRQKILAWNPDSVTY